MSQPDLTVLFAELIEYADLPANWDADDAAPISAATVEDAKALLRDIAAVAGDAWIEPSVAPCPDGGIGINWHPDDCGGRWAMIDMEPSGRFGVVVQPEGGEPRHSYLAREQAIVWALWAMEGACKQSRQDTSTETANAL